MARCRVVTPELVRLPLSDGDYLDVKKELNAGEYTELLESLVKEDHFARYLQYIVAWSFVGLDGKPLPYSHDQPQQARVDTLKSLDLATMTEMIEALDAHQLRENAEREARKNGQTTGNGSSPVSPSVA